jgi:hypothetical protein
MQKLLKNVETSLDAARTIAYATLFDLDEMVFAGFRR